MIDDCLTVVSVLCLSVNAVSTTWKLRIGFQDSMQASIFGASPMPGQSERVAAGRASGVKMGDDGGWSLISPDGMAPTRMVGGSASLIFSCTMKSRGRFLLAPGLPGSPWKRAVNRLCLCVRISGQVSDSFNTCERYNRSSNFNWVSNVSFQCTAHWMQVQYMLLYLCLTLFAYQNVSIYNTFFHLVALLFHTRDLCIIMMESSWVGQARYDLFCVKSAVKPQPTILSGVLNMGGIGKRCSFWLVFWKWYDMGHSYYGTLIMSHIWYREPCVNELVIFIARFSY